MENQENPAKKLRSACDTCHQAKMRCSGGRPCAGCLDSGHQCFYSVSHRVGRPKGTKNKRTLEAMKNQQQQQAPQSQKNGSKEAEVSTKVTEPAPQRPYSNSINDNLTSFENMFLDATTANGQDLFSSLTNSDTFWDSATCDFVGDLSLENGQDILGLKDPHSLGSMHDNTAYIYPPSMFNDGENALNNLNPSNIRTGKGGSESPQYYPAPMSISSTSPPPSPSSCKCLQHHADLLCRLKDLEHGQNKPSIDLVLVGVQQALEPWKRLIQCRVCHQNGDQEVLLLSAMSIRAVLRRVQSLFFESGYSRGSGGSPDESARGLKQQKVTAGRQADSVRLTVGIYEVTGEERTLVTDLLLRNTLGKIEFALMCLKEKLERSTMRRISVETSGSDGDHSMMEQSGGGAAETDHVQQILRGLESTVQALGRTLRSTNATSLRQL